MPAAVQPAQPVFVGGISSSHQSNEVWPIDDIKAALAVIPNHHADWEWWWRIGAAVFAASGGSHAGSEAWCDWSRQCVVGRATDDPAGAWRRLANCPVSNIRAGTLVWEAQRINPMWKPPSTTSQHLMPAVLRWKKAPS
jgi:hypothetical protein